ncbi:MAG: ATP-grasp domain-containing protein [bacterium]|nr:ATP-grasp domain-containing protein [bacterium]
MNEISRDKLQLRLGVLGGGQLGRMLLPPALRFNLAPGFLDPDPAAPVRANAAYFQTGDLMDFATVCDFGRRFDLVTTEIEHVNTEALAQLESEGVLVRPSSRILALVQDKLKQKEFYRDNGIPTAEFAALDNRADLIERMPELRHLFPAMQKLRRDGYDGRGVQKLPDPADFATTDPAQIAGTEPGESKTAARVESEAFREALEKVAFDAPSLIERRVDFVKEIAVIVSRNPAGQVALYPPVEMEFHPTANLVELLFAPAQIDRDVERQANEIATKIAELLELEGLLAVELFVTNAGQVLVNEIAPRTHNSGHHTIEACVTSQFEQHLRAVLDLPPGDTALVAPAAMVNLLGTRGTGPAHYRGMEKILAMPGVHVHLYGKIVTRPFRKMGHVTITGPSGATNPDNGEATRALLAVRERAREIRAIVEIIGESDA